MATTIKIAQILDSPIEVRASPAFARVQLSFYDTKYNNVIVELDMESFIRVMEPMDNGMMAVRKMNDQIPTSSRLKNWFAGLLRGVK